MTRNRPEVNNVPPIIMHNGIEFVSTREACRRMRVTPQTISKRVRNGQLKPFRLPQIPNGSLGRAPLFFRATDIAKFIPQEPS